MKRYGNLWEKLVSWDNLLRAAHKARQTSSNVVRCHFFAVIQAR